MEQASKIRVGADQGADIGPMTMPSQIDVIRRHIDDAIARGGRAVLGGPDAVQPPYVQPTILVDVPEDSAAVREETFGPTLTVKRVAAIDEAVELANAVSYGLGGVGLRQGARDGDRPAAALRHGRRSTAPCPSPACRRCRSAASATPASAASTARTACASSPGEGDREAPHALAAAVDDLRPQAPAHQDDHAGRPVVHGRGR